MSISKQVEDIRGKIDNRLSAESREEYGQFMTNWRISSFMSQLIDLQKVSRTSDIKILDPGAGVGSLSACLALRLRDELDDQREIFVEAFEVDANMRQGLEETHKLLSEKGVSSKIEPGDFIERAVGYLCPEIGVTSTEIGDYDLAILNPPYKKIQSKSKHRLLLRKVGIETSNLYTAFWHLSILLAKPGAQICSIVPRSFCNGTYFKHFRKSLKSSCHIDSVHLFESRKDAFSENDVLQENVIFSVTKKGLEEHCLEKTQISTSSNDHFSNLSRVDLETHKIWSGGSDNFIFLPTSKDHIDLLAKFQSMPCSLEDLDLKISTGPVVQFRMREHLQHVASEVPMLYCSNLRKGAVTHEPAAMKSPPFINKNLETEKWLVKNIPYLLIRRFSSKEEKRRIFSSIYTPEMIYKDGELIGIDNKVNYATSPLFSEHSDYLKGFYVYLSSSIVDEYYRMVSGHTQVNAGDLRFLRYPSAERLKAVGELLGERVTDDQKEIDCLAQSFFESHGSL